MAKSDVYVRVEESATEEIRERVIGGLVAFNIGEAGESSHAELAVVARGGTEIVGGLLGHTNWNWLFIAQLWVSDKMRGDGLGRKLVGEAEAEARRRGCTHAHVDTFSFQAVPFYQRLGYTVFGELTDYPPGHKRYFLQKRDLRTS